MEDLRLVGVTDDGSRLVVESAGGHTFGLALDERLHAALRGDRARLGQLQIAIENELRPREIQARIRSGESAEDIAAQAGLPVDRVRRYEGPVLLERTVMAQNAQTVGVRRVTDAQTTPLGELVQARLEDHQVPEDSVDWDSWLRQDGLWVVRLAYRAGGRDRAASWLYDPRKRTVEPLDEDARWLSDEQRTAPEPAARRTPRLAAVRAGEPAEQTGRQDAVPAGPQRGPRKVPDLPPGVHGDPASGTRAADTGAAGTQDTPQEHAGAAAGGPTVADEPAAEPAPDRGPAVRPTPVRATGRGRAGKRATVPTWDEILFGGPKREPE